MQVSVTLASEDDGIVWPLASVKMNMWPWEAFVFLLLYHVYGPASLLVKNKRQAWDYW